MLFLDLGGGFDYIYAGLLCIKTKMVHKHWHRKYASWALGPTRAERESLGSQSDVLGWRPPPPFISVATWTTYLTSLSLHFSQLQNGD